MPSHSHADNLTNMVWVEQPVGVGFTQGKPDIQNEYELAQEFMGFWKKCVSRHERLDFRLIDV